MSRPNRLRVRRAKLANLEPLEPKTLLSGTNFAAHFDFGLRHSPVEEAYISGLQHTYTQDRGFGWQSVRGLGAIDRGEPNALLQDFNQGRDHTFMVDVPVGVYDVTPTLGDSRAARDQISIWIEGDLVASNVRTSKGEYTSLTFRVIVADGQLNMRLADQGGVNSTFALNALSVVEVTPLLVHAGADRTGVEGKPVAFQATASGTGPFEIVWEFGDGSTQTGSLTPTHTYLDNGTYTATVRVTDAYGITSTDSLKVTVDNVAPTASLSGPSSGETFVPLQFAASATDSSPIDQSAGFDYRWLFGDGTRAIGKNVTHTFAEAGTFTITMTATDKDGGSTTVSTTTTIAASANTAPYLDPVGDQEVDEQADLTFVVTASDQDVPAHGLTFSLLDAPEGASIDPLTGVFSWTPSEAQGPASYSLILQVSDGQLTDQETITVRVNEVNTAPVLTPISNQTAITDTELRFQAVATDPDLPAQILTYSLQNAPTGASIDPATGQFSWTPTADQIATHSMTVLVSDGQATASQSFDVTVHAPLQANTILIDQAWLLQRGEGPYILDQAYTTYVLQTDVTVPGTAFVALNRDITLDLNGYTVTYGDRNPIMVFNGGFEQGSGNTAPGWNLTEAPNAAVAPNVNYLWGEQVLRISNFNQPQRIVSDPIPIELAGHTYAATITPARGDYRTHMILSVIDAVSGVVLATGSSANVERGFSAVAEFAPRTTNPVRIQIDVIPPNGITTSVDLDAATLAVSHDYGVIASRNWSGGVQGFANLGSNVQAVYDSSRAKVSNFSIKNGGIVQGRARGFASSPLYFQQIAGLNVENIETLATGDDTTTLNAVYSSGAVAIRNSTFREDIVNVTNRAHGVSTIRLRSTTATIQVENNRFLGTAQIGITADINNGYALTIRGNEIRQNAVTTNAYGIVLSAISNFDVSGNTIVATNGRGILVDGYRPSPVTTGTIRNNYVDVRELPNREQGSKVESRALRLRNNVDSMGPHRDLDISGNTFIAWSGSGMAQTAYGVRISYLNKAGAMNDANINLYDNTIKAIATSSDAAYKAQALSVDGVDSGINLHIWDNVLESNETSLALTGSDGGDIHGVTLTANTLRRSADGPVRFYQGILAGYWINQIRDVRILDTRLEGGATAGITWIGSGTKEVAIGWSLNLTARDSSGRVLPGATVQILDKDWDTVFEATTDATGHAIVPLVTTVFRQTGTDPRVITADHRGPHRVTVTSGERNKSIDIDLTETTTLDVVLD